MTWTVSTTPAAEADIAEAVEWYEDQRPGLGERLLAEIDGLNKRIAANPYRFPVIYRDARKGSLRRFPYVLIFRLIGEEARLLSFLSYEPRSQALACEGSPLAQLTPLGAQSAAAMYGSPRRRPSASIP